MLVAAAAGTFPPPDGVTEVLASPPGWCDAVVGFTAHLVVAGAVDPDEVLAHLPIDDIGAAMDVRFLTWLAERLRAEPGMLDAVLAAEPSDAEPSLVLTEASATDHPRVQRAARYRSDLRVFEGEGRGSVLTIGRGLAGRLEVSVEVDPGGRDAGLGRALAEAARTLAPAGEPLFAQVSPGNAASIRAFLAAGYRPIGSEVLFLRRA
jgi:GNAT superfamily N-acetyltransferase